MPRFVAPCLATLREHAPPGTEWVHEIKYDGYRIQLHAAGDRVAILTRRGFRLAAALSDARCGSAGVAGGRRRPRR
jgi:bifunctional non-homologous end joining protein LigD